jgi:hypothetical protein
MAPDYQPAMESCPTNITIVLFYDTVVLEKSLYQAAKELFHHQFGTAVL